MFWFAIGFVVALIIQALCLAEQRDRAIVEQQRSDEVTRFMVGVFKAADPSQSLAHDTPIGIVIDNARANLRSTLKSSPAIRSRILLALAEVYVAIDDFPAAVDLGKQAMQDYRQSASGDTRESIAMLDRFSAMLLATSNNDLAKDAADEAVRLHASLG